MTTDLINQLNGDINQLQIAGNRINGPAKTFEDINGLIATVRELEKELQEAEFDYYRTVSELLVDVQTQMSKFEAYLALPHVAIIKQKIIAIESELRRQIQWSFREISTLTSSDKYGHEVDPAESTVDVDVSALAQVYLVVDALGSKFRTDLLERFSQMQLLSYDKLFQPGTKYSGLQFMDQRYAWFEFLVRVVDEKMSSVLPARWIVPYYLFLEFSRRTRNHLVDVLSQMEKESPQALNDVATVVRAVKGISNFEAKMAASFLERQKAEGELGEALVVIDSMKDAFDPYLGPYIKVEKKGLEDLISTVMRGEETPIPKPGEQPPEHAPPSFNAGEPYDSSRQIFEYIKAALKRCMGFSTGSALLQLSKEFGFVLYNYAEAMKARCPQPEVVAKGDKPPVYRINKTMEKTLCKVICTGEYCIDTIPALETIMKQKIKEQYKDSLDFSTQIDIFQDMVAFAMNILACGEVQRMQEMFQSMRVINWSGDIVVGDVNDHIKQMLKVFVDCVPRIRVTMSPIYFQTFCNKLITVFLDQYLGAIWKLRRVSKTGGAQLLMDTNGIKEFLVKMPNVKLAEGKEPIVLSRSFFKFLEIKIGRIENILKIIIADDSSVDDMFVQLLPDATPKEKDTILILKGLKLGVPVPLPMKEFGDKVKDVGENTAGKIKAGAEETVNTLKTGFQSMGGNLRNAFGDMFHGNLFMDASGHSDNASGHGPSNGGAQSKKTDFKGAATAAMAFKRPTGAGSAAGTTPAKKP